MKNRQTGFSLVELGVAVTIIALLLAGALVPLSVQVDVRNVTDTQRNMELVREAVIGFAQANGRLPCPADGTIASGTAGAGIENCANGFGVVPWATLGVPETDGWGKRFSYWVTPIFADAMGTTFGVGCTPVPAPTLSSFAFCTPGTFTVNTRDPGTHTAVPVGQFLPAVIVSHGKNGFGAYRPAGGAPVAVPTGADELANANHSNLATTFVSRTPTQSAAGCNDNPPAGAFCEFDDIVVMVSSSILTARMVAAGRLP